METLAYPVKEYGSYSVGNDEPVTIYDQSGKVIY